MRFLGLPWPRVGAGQGREESLKSEPQQEIRWEAVHKLIPDLGGLPGLFEEEVKHSQVITSFKK